MPNTAFYYTDEGGRVYPKRILYFNVHRHQATVMNGAVFVVGQDERAAMDGREWIYDAVPVTADLQGVHIEGGDALMYVGKPEHEVDTPTSPRDTALRSSYLRMLDRVLDGVGPSVSAEWKRTTDPVPEHLVIDDALDESRPDPWEAAGHAYRAEFDLDQEA